MPLGNKQNKKKEPKVPNVRKQQFIIVVLSEKKENRD